MIARYMRNFGIMHLVAIIDINDFLALGNFVCGVNLGGLEGDVSRFEQQYFFLPLCTAGFSPLGVELGIIDWFTLILGLVGLLTLTIHGANWIIFKTNASINPLLKLWVFRLSFALTAAVILSLVAWLSVRPDPFERKLRFCIAFRNLCLAC